MGNAHPYRSKQAVPRLHVCKEAFWEPRVTILKQDEDYALKIAFPLSHSARLPVPARTQKGPPFVYDLCGWGGSA
jgi:hypothetical protein